MTNARARVAPIAVLLAGLVGWAAPQPAGAFESYYNCVDKASGDWCDGRANSSFDGLHSWDWNQGWNPGAGTFTVCQHVWNPSTTNELTGSSCGSNAASHYYGDVQCACYEAEVKQTSGSAKDIDGYADAAY